VYCSGDDYEFLVVMDGASDSILDSVVVGHQIQDLFYVPQFNKVYCASDGSLVTVIDGATNNVVTTVEVGVGPSPFVWNPAESRVYVANWAGSSVSILRDSATGVGESFRPHAASTRPVPTVVRGVLFLSEAASPKAQAASLMDAAGRKVLDLRPGANDVRALAPGVYFVCEDPQAASSKPQAVRKIVIAR